MGIRLVGVSVLLVIGMGQLQAEEIDDIKEKLYLAKSRYDGEVIAFRKIVNDWFDKRENELRAAANTKQLQTLKAEREKFDQGVDYPDDGPRDPIVTLKTARTNLATAYNTAIIDLIKLKMDTEAEKLEKEYNRVTIDQALAYGKKTYFSSVTATDVRIHRGIKFEKAKRVMIGGTEYPQSIYTHPDEKNEAQASYILNSKSKVFTTKVAVLPFTKAFKNAKATVTFEVLGDGKVLWKSDPITRTDEPQTCMINVSKVQRLTLRVTSAGDVSWSYAHWLDPAVYD